MFYEFLTVTEQLCFGAREFSSGMLRNSAKTSRSARLNFSRDLLYTAGSLEGSKAVRIFLETGSARPRRPPMVLLIF